MIIKQKWSCQTNSPFQETVRKYRVGFFWRGWFLPSQWSSGQLCSSLHLFSERRQGEVTLMEVFALLHRVGLSQEEGSVR